MTTRNEKRRQKLLKELAYLTELQETVGNFGIPLKVVDAMQLVKDTALLTETEQYKKCCFWLDFLESHIKRLQDEADRIAHIVNEPTVQTAPKGALEVTGEVSTNG